MRGESATLSEDEIIARFFGPLATSRGADRLRDDAATFAVRPDEEVVVTQDALAAGVHFFTDDPPEAIAAKTLRVNLSDLAAKGATPFGYTIALALAEGTGEDWLEHFARGLAADQARYGVSLLGGDTLRAAGGTTIAVTALGRVPRGATVRRRTARPGDVVWVTGTFGDASLHVVARTDRGRAWRLDEAALASLRERYLYPDPPVAAHVCVRRFASAAMDVSDGLLGDLRKLVRVAAVSAVVDPAAVPLSPVVRAIVEADPTARTTALTGGDDYQILATVPPIIGEAFREALADAGVSAVPIGRIERGTGEVFLEEAGARTRVGEHASYRHF